MMKVSDPILFGHCVREFFSDAFEKHADVLDEIGANPNNGLASVYNSIESKLPAAEAKAIISDFEACYEDRPWLAMVNSDKGITNLHVPSDIIIDASMPVVIRDSGQMWNKNNEQEDTKCLVSSFVKFNVRCTCKFLKTFLFLSIDSRSLLCYHVPRNDQLCQNKQSV